ncbi:MAG: aminotransferase class V-fold PLP-dependent enzyme [Candidatus Fermentithermobacillus carboniphilus]|uniref:Aminotransferase class V-fold PLP-dependent enzyme n=1 Tax=Candidatus Fermentithermobacillus carboniphilus TaxID=3085328 RepID=A0AAT9LGL1_9FIRM|nr:MAG: aminotransferase class V-fold PLP-dependent enzyme [Candidatus Fermentithermobacillus carboniphilus]
MKSYPLKQLTLDEAIQVQFRLVDIIQSVFSGDELLSLGDLGIVPGLGRPKTTAKVEEVLARFFGTESAVLVRGAGSGALRLAIWAMLRPGAKLLIHQAPIYSTTKTLIESMGINVLPVDMNDLADVRRGCALRPDAVLIQRSRQVLTDRYDVCEVIEAIRSILPDVPIVTDENYAVMKVHLVGAAMGADASAFSMFKLLGPEGIGCVVGRSSVIQRVRGYNYSGGSQVQGHEAMEALRSLVYVPVAQAIQARVVDEIAARLNEGEVPGVISACVANAQSRVVLVEFEEPIAANVLQAARDLGAVPYPVGAESRYEIGAMFYRVSGSFLQASPEMKDRVIRINPMRAGPDTVIRILRKALERARSTQGQGMN